MLADVKERHELIGNLPDYEISHMVRVGRLVETLSAKLSGVDSGKARVLGEAAFYHDIGKLCVPLQILLKKEKLSVTEKNLIRMHAVNGQHILNQFCKEGSLTKDFLRVATRAALYHHERWDGSGYPFGLEAKQIPFIGRITSVCDSYDAITSFRPYISRKGHEQACEELEQGAGCQFDPELTGVFLQYHSEMKSCTDHQGATEW